MQENHIRPINKPFSVYDIEEEITKCWGIVDEIKLLNEAVQDKEIDRDSIANILLGLEYLYELKFQKLMESYKELLQNQNLKKA